jgi:hypothetical protein
MRRNSTGGHIIADEPPEGWSHCMICKDLGIIGGDWFEFRYCLCPAGIALRAKDPQAVEAANATRDKLRKLTGVK